MASVSLNRDDVGGPIFIPISLTSNLSEITGDTNVDFAIALNDPPSTPPTFNISFYEVLGEPTLTAAVAAHKNLEMHDLEVQDVPVITPTEDGGQFSFYFDSTFFALLHSQNAVVTLAVTIAGENSLGICSLAIHMS